MKETRQLIKLLAKLEVKAEQRRAANANPCTYVARDVESEAGKIAGSCSHLSLHLNHWMKMKEMDWIIG